MADQVTLLKGLVNVAIPEVYQKGLSYYEVLTAVVNKVNELIEQSNDYFSVDTTTIITNILTEWVADGTLEAIVNDVLVGLGSRTYTEQNYITNGETVTDSLDALDVSVNDVFDAIDTKIEAQLEQLSINVKSFGAKGDGITDDTQTINDALLYLASARTSPTGYNGYGLGTLYFPKGKYLINGTVAVASPIGLRFIGDGIYTTTLFRTLDTGNMFNFTTYISLEFKDMLIEHIPQGDRATWTTTAINLNGSGGGNGFKINNVEVTKFATAIKYNNTANEDTNFITQCTFVDNKTVLYVNNTQNVINKIEKCQFFGQIDKAFDIYGFGYTSFDTLNVVMNGTFLDIRGTTSNSTAQYLMKNCKFEFRPLGTNTGTAVMIKTSDNPACMADIKMINCGVSGGSPDPNIYQFDILGGFITLDVDGGQWAGTKIRVKQQTTYQKLTVGYIKFRNCRSAPSRTITKISGTSGGNYLPVYFKNCDGISNIVIGNQTCPSVEKNINMQSGITGVSANGICNEAVGDAMWSFPSYSQNVFVLKVTVFVKARYTATSATFKLYFDSALASLIDTITIPNGVDTTPKSYEFIIPESATTTDGVYVVSQGSSPTNIDGKIYVETISV